MGVQQGHARTPLMRGNIGQEVAGFHATKLGEFTDEAALECRVGPGIGEVQVQGQSVWQRYLLPCGARDTDDSGLPAVELGVELIIGAAARERAPQPRAELPRSLSTSSTSPGYNIAFRSPMW